MKEPVVGPRAFEDVLDAAGDELRYELHTADTATATGSRRSSMHSPKTSVKSPTKTYQ